MLARSVIKAKLLLAVAYLTISILLVLKQFHKESIDDKINEGYCYLFSVQASQP